MQKSDSIASLPSDSHPINNDELQILKMLLKNENTWSSSFFATTKEAALLGMLFFILSLPHANTLVLKYVTVANKNDYALLATKTLVFMIVAIIIRKIVLRPQ